VRFEGTKRTSGRISKEAKKRTKTIYVFMYVCMYIYKERTREGKRGHLFGGRAVRRRETNEWKNLEGGEGTDKGVAAGDAPVAVLV